jgi:hypothetical protein
MREGLHTGWTAERRARHAPAHVARTLSLADRLTRRPRTVSAHLPATVGGAPGALPQHDDSALQRRVCESERDRGQDLRPDCNLAAAGIGSPTAYGQASGYGTRGTERRPRALRGNADPIGKQTRHVATVETLSLAPSLLPRLGRTVVFGWPFSLRVGIFPRYPQWPFGVQTRRWPAQGLQGGDAPP